MARNLISSNATIKAIKQGDPRKRLSDGDGLLLLRFVEGGSHGWRFDYRIEGTRKMLSLGTYPDTSLAAARRKAEAARELVAERSTPAVSGRPRRPPTFRHVRSRCAASRFAAARLVRSKRARVVRCQARRLGSELCRQDHRPPQGRCVPVNRSGAGGIGPQLLEILRRIEFRGVVETAHRALENCNPWTAPALDPAQPATVEYSFARQLNSSEPSIAARPTTG